MPLRLDAGAAGFEARFAALLGAKRQAADDVDAAVATIVEDVRRRGDAAVLDYTECFDGAVLTAQGTGRRYRSRARGLRAGDRGRLAARRRTHPRFP
jgi:histidinol dehydrogenase